MSYQSYEEIGVTTDVLTASPHKLIELLLDKCFLQIQLSKKYLNENNIKQKCQCISKAIDIVSYLRLSLNFDDPQAKKLSEELDKIYSYIDNTLLKANLHNSVEKLDEAEKLLETIRSAWKQIGK